MLYNDITTTGSSAQTYAGNLKIAGSTVNLTYADSSSFSWTDSGSKSILGLAGGEDIIIKNASSSKAYIGQMDTSDAARLSLGVTGSAPHHSQVYGTATNDVKHVQKTAGSYRSGDSSANDALAGSGASDLTLTWIDNSGSAPTASTDIGNIQYSLAGQSVTVSNGYFLNLSLSQRP